MRDFALRSREKPLDCLSFCGETGAMKQLIRLTILSCACAALALTAVAGPEPLPSGKEMKQVAPAPPPECNWTGFYIGLNVGGQFGHAENTDVDGYNSVSNTISLDTTDKPWGYDQSGVVAGGQVGYNYQWNWVVLGVEADGGYMNLDGSGREPDRFLMRNDVIGHSDSDFYTTVRGRLGFAFGHWLFYGTGGGIGVNWETRVTDDCFTGNCGTGTINAHKEEFDWGWTGGGGVEYMLGCHWTVRAEYLRYQLDEQHFRGEDFISGVRAAGVFRWDARDEGNIIRGALNYKF
jgi:outer membrane immunogenic protein